MYVVSLFIYSINWGLHLIFSFYVISFFFLLTGGHKEFHKRHKEFCEDTLLPPEEKPSLSSRLSPVMDSSTSTSTSSSDIDNQPASRVLPFLYLGNQKNAADLQLLQSLGVTRVLNVTSDLPGYHEAEGISYRKLPASDSGQQNLKQYFEEAFDFIGKISFCIFLKFTICLCLNIAAPFKA